LNCHGNELKLLLNSCQELNTKNNIQTLSIQFGWDPTPTHIVELILVGAIITILSYLLFRIGKALFKKRQR